MNNVNDKTETFGVKVIDKEGKVLYDGSAMRTEVVGGTGRGERFLGWVMWHFPVNEKGDTYTPILMRGTDDNWKELCGFNIYTKECEFTLSHVGEYSCDFRQIRTTLPATAHTEGEENMDSKMQTELRLMLRPSLTALKSKYEQLNEEFIKKTVEEHTGLYPALTEQIGLVTVRLEVMYHEELDKSFVNVSCDLRGLKETVSTRSFELNNWRDLVHACDWLDEQRVRLAASVL